MPVVLDEYVSRPVGTTSYFHIKNGGWIQPGKHASTAALPIPAELMRPTYKKLSESKAFARRDGLAKTDDTFASATFMTFSRLTRLFRITSRYHMA